MELGVLKNGWRVVDRHNSHLHGNIVALLGQALPQIDPKGEPFFKNVFNFGHVIGESVCVETTDADEIVYAQRAGRRTVTRFVKGRKGCPCSTLVIILMKDKTGLQEYVLITAFVGELSEREPNDLNIRDKVEFLKASQFWANHALIWDESEIDNEVDNPRWFWFNRNFTAYQQPLLGRIK